MRLSLLTSSAAVVLALASFACSGSDEPAAANDDVSAPPRNDFPSTEQSSGTNEPAEENTDPASGDNSDGSYGLPDAGSGNGGGGNGGGAGTLCQPSSVTESEPNNDAASADVVPGQSGTFCGKISSDTDVDFVKFTLPANAKSFGMNQNTTSGAIKIEPSVDGEAFSFGGSYPFKPGKEYLIKISTSGGALDYRIGVTITQ